MSLLCTLTTIAQEQPTNESIKEIFEKTIKEANRYQDYKVVKQVQLEQLKQQTIQRINQLKDSITLLQEQIDNKDNNITSLNEKINLRDTDLATVQAEKNSISLFGLQLDKLTYNLILWSIIGILLLLLVILVFRYRNSNEITRISLTNLKLAEEELETFKRRSLEKEQKLSRQLLDERKKNQGQ